MSDCLKDGQSAKLSCAQKRRSNNITAFIDAAYCRTSTEIQRDKGYSVPRQKELLTEHARTKGCGNLTFYIDDGHSSADLERPELVRLRRDIEAGRIRSLRVYSYDRLFRSLIELLSFINFVQKHKIEFISLKEQIDTTTPQGNLQLQIMGSLAEFERRQVVQRVQDAMYHKVRKGDFCGGQPAYGYRVKDKALFQHPEESKVVEVIYDKFIESKSIRGVTLWLNKNGHKTKRGKTWATATIKRILWNPLYMGIQTYGKRKGGAKTYAPEAEWMREKVRGLEPIISKEKFDKVQSLIKARAFKKPDRRGRVYILSGLLRCECGGRMGGYTHPDKRKKGRSYSYYKCNDHIHKGSCVCPGNSFTKEDLEELVLQEVNARVNLKFDAKEKASAQLDGEASSNQKRMQTLQANLRQLSSKKQKLLDLYSEDGIDKSGLKEAIARIDSQTNSTNEEINKLSLELDPREQDMRADVFSQLNDLKGELFNLSRKTKQTILQQVIKEIVVTRDHKVKVSIYEI
ncbi:MAG: recombinase family protein [Candidatus Omnitrophota bacterium]|jgi:site-specific DNA recombinase